MDRGYLIRKSRFSRERLLILFSLIISVSLLSPLVDIVKYFKYLVGPLSILFFFLGNFRITKGDLSSVDIGFLILFLYGLVTVIISNDVILGLKDLFFIFCYLAPVLLFNKDGVLTDRNIRIIFYIFSLCFLLSTLGRNYGGFSIFESKAPFEGPESFVFGGFFLYFMMLKDKKMLLLSLLLMFLSMKRIALLGVVVAAGVWAVPFIYRLLNSNRILFLLGNYAYILFLYLLVVGFFDDVVELYTGKGVAEITLGRVSHYVGVLENLGSDDIAFFFGSGAGSTYELAMQYDYYDRTGGNLHSDTLKVFYEYGFFLFSLFFIFISSVKGKGALALSVYSMCLFFTDNIIIYVSVMFFLLLLIKQSEINFVRLSNGTVNS